MKTRRYAAPAVKGLMWFLKSTFTCNLLKCTTYSNALLEWLFVLTFIQNFNDVFRYRDPQIQVGENDS